MSTEPMRLLASNVVDDLSKNIACNLPRYKDGNFVDMEKESGWSIEMTLAQWDPSIAGSLDPSGTPAAEIKNSLLIYKELQGMTPALACEERLWARLCHIECLDYARKRWLGKEETLESAVRHHFFAAGLRGYRDRNAIGRLWWNGHVAALAFPDDIELGLRRLLGRANTRLQIVDRADTAFRQPLVAGIFRLLGTDNWINSFDAAIADFMFEVNMRSGGIVFEALTETEVHSHLNICLEFAKIRRTAPAKAAA